MGRLLEARSESEIAVINAPNVFIATANACETDKRIGARSEPEIAVINDPNVFIPPTAVRHFLRTPQKVSHGSRKQTIEDCLKPDPSQKSLLSMLLTFSKLPPTPVRQTKELEPDLSQKSLLSMTPNVFIPPTAVRHFLRTP